MVSKGMKTPSDAFIESRRKQTRKERFVTFLAVFLPCAAVSCGMAILCLFFVERLEIALILGVPTAFLIIGAFEKYIWDWLIDFFLLGGGRK
jgi:hypothetical protein